MHPPSKSSSLWKMDIGTIKSDRIDEYYVQLARLVFSLSWQVATNHFHRSFFTLLPSPAILTIWIAFLLFFMCCNCNYSRVYIFINWLQKLMYMMLSKSFKYYWFIMFQMFLFDCCTFVGWWGWGVMWLGSQPRHVVSTVPASVPHPPYLLCAVLRSSKDEIMLDNKVYAIG